MSSNETAILNWYMTNVCNFDCSYCFGHAKGEKAEALPVDKVISCLKATGRPWRVNLVGGEVMLIPDFVSTCVKLVEAGMRISVETNLSISSKVAEFADKLDPAKVECIHISTHIIEREKRRSVDRMLADLDLLRRKGFSIYVNYVLHPSLLPRFLADNAFFSSHGVHLKPAPYVGWYEGRLYPEAYTTKERRVILEGNPEAGSYAAFNARGLMCRAGMDFLILDSTGIFRRCHGVEKILGTVSEGLTLYENAIACPAQACPCWGHRFLVDREAAERIAKRFRTQSFKAAVRDNPVARPVYRWLCKIKDAVI